MSPVREAVALPAVFLTVTFLGGIRTGADLRLIPPPLTALTLGLVVLAALTRAGVLETWRLMNQQRTGLENLSGLIVLATLYAASTQAFNLVIPDEGLLHGIFATFFLVQLLTTFASVRDRGDMLRNLTVLFGAAFVLRFIVLEALYAPDGGTLKRVLTALVQAGTLGSLTYVPNSASTGYIAFAALALYLFGLFLLHEHRSGASGMLERRSDDSVVEGETVTQPPLDNVEPHRERFPS